MNFLNWVDPLTGAILAASVIPPLILLYFLKLRRRTHPIACTLLWAQSVEDLRANAPFQKLRKSLLLLLQLLALIILALALMQPQLLAGNRRGGRVVLLIDNSSSMNATDAADGTTRLEEAKDRAKRLVESIQGGGLFGGGSDEVMVIGFNERATVYSNFTSARQQLISAIDEIGPTNLTSSIEEALKLARAHTTVVNPDKPELSTSGTDATFELFSDGQIPDFAEQPVRGERLNYYRVGTEQPANVAFSSVAVERLFESPTEVQVFVGLANYGMTGTSTTIQLSVDGDINAPSWVRDVPIDPATIDEVTGQLIPGRSNVVYGPFAQPADAVIEVLNVDEDALSSDNAAAIVTPPPKNLSVALVEPMSYITKVAMEGMRLRRVQELSAAEFQQMADDGELEQFDVIVLEDVQLDTLPPGRYLSFGAALPIEGFNVAGTGEGMLILNWEKEHPILRYVDLDNMVIGRFVKLQEMEGMKILAGGSTGTEFVPAIVEFARGSTHSIYLAFNHFHTNWFTNQGFIIFLMNAIEYLGTVGEAFAVQDLAPGESITTRLPSTATGIQITMPDGIQESVQTDDPTSLTWTRTHLAGLYEVSWQMPGEAERRSRRFAINQFSSTESDLRTADLNWGGVEVSASSGGTMQTPLWPWALGFCLFVLMFEWWVYHRRTYI